MTNQDTRSLKSDKQFIERCKKVLKEARANAPGFLFVDSCYRFFERAGFLTIKQVEALERIKPRKQGFAAFYDADETDYDNWDMAPGEKG